MLFTKCAKNVIHKICKKCYSRNALVYSIPSKMKPLNSHHPWTLLLVNSFVMYHKMNTIVYKKKKPLKHAIVTSCTGLINVHFIIWV